MTTARRLRGTGQRHSPAAIGGRLKAARLARRKTLTEVAVASGLTKGFLSKLERDQANASVASLIRLCDVLEISVASLFEAPTGELVRRSEYPRINFGGEGMREFLLTPRREQRLQAILSEIEPAGGSGDELYTLPAEIEFAFVLAGRLLVRVEDRELVLEEGDTLTFPAQSPHGFRNADDAAPARVLWVFAPALPAS
ncbi:MAG TPA: XRE family transcriptional regulator [Gaiellaceae bacterium]|nr:XRE family transcriptional regulator [Gaiellaceae bacterium]